MRFIIDLSEKKEVCIWRSVLFRWREEKATQLFEII